MLLSCCWFYYLCRDCIYVSVISYRLSLIYCISHIARGLVKDISVGNSRFLLCSVLRFRSGIILGFSCSFGSGDQRTCLGICKGIV